MSGEKILIVVGLVLVTIGIIWHFGGKIIPFGKLPGDISIEHGNFHIYFPITTCLVISLILTLAFWIFQRFFR